MLKAIRISVLKVLFFFFTTLFSVMASAQTEDAVNDAFQDNGSSASEVVQKSSFIKFRGFQNASEDLPFMSEDWRVSFFQLASVEADRLDDRDTASLFMYNFFSFNYRLSQDERFAIRPVFFLESPGRNSYNEEVSKWKLTMDDLYFSYSRFNLPEVGPFGARINLRVYVPTSERSQNSGTITRIRPEYFLETSLGRHSGIELQFKGEYFVNSKDAYTFKTQQGREITTTNKEAEFESVIEYKYRVNRLFYLKPRVSWLDEWKLSSPSNRLSSRHTQDFGAGVGVEWRPTERFNTTIQFTNVTQVYNNRPGFRKPKMWLPENNEIVALSNYRF